MTIGNTSNSGNNVADNVPFSWNHNNNGNVLLVLLFFDIDSASGNMYAKYNSLSADVHNQGSWQSRDGVYMAIFKNPAQGTHSIDISSDFASSAVGVGVSLVSADTLSQPDSNLAGNSDFGGTATSISVNVNSSQAGDFTLGCVGVYPKAGTSAWALTNGTIINSLTLACNGNADKIGIFGYLTAASSGPGNNAFAGTWTGNATGYGAVFGLSINPPLNRFNFLDLAGD